MRRSETRVLKNLLFLIMLVFSQYMGIEAKPKDKPVGKCL